MADKQWLLIDSQLCKYMRALQKKEPSKKPKNSQHL